MVRASIRCNWTRCITSNTRNKPPPAVVTTLHWSLTEWIQAESIIRVTLKKTRQFFNLKLTVRLIGLDRSEISSLMSPERVLRRRPKPDLLLPLGEKRNTLDDRIFLRDGLWSFSSRTSSLLSREREEAGELIWLGVLVRIGCQQLVAENSSKLDRPGEEKSPEEEEEDAEWLSVVVGHFCWRNLEKQEKKDLLIRSTNQSTRTSSINSIKSNQSIDWSINQSTDQSSKWPTEQTKCYKNNCNLDRQNVPVVTCCGCKYFSSNVMWKTNTKYSILLLITKPTAIVKSNCRKQPRRLIDWLIEQISIKNSFVQRGKLGWKRMKFQYYNV